MREVRGSEVEPVQFSRPSSFIPWMWGIGGLTALAWVWQAVQQQEFALAIRGGVVLVLLLGVASVYARRVAVLERVIKQMQVARLEAERIYRVPRPEPGPKCDPSAVAAEAGLSGGGRRS